MKQKNNYLAVSLKVCIAVLLILLFYRSTDWRTILSCVTSINVSIWLTLICCVSFETVMKTIRWKKLLPEYTFGELLIVNIKSGFFILVLPGQLISEGIKPFLLKRNSASTQHIIMSVLVDKILGIIAVFISGLFGFMLSEIKIGYGPKISLIIAILLILGMLFLIRIPSVYNLILKSLGISNLDTNSMNGIKKKVYNILSIWKNYVKDPRIIIECAVLGVFPQLSTVFSGFIVSHAIGAQISFINWLWIDAYSTLALLLPITIGGIGVRDGSLVGAMSLLNIESYKALSVSMILFIVQIIRALVGLVVYLVDKNK